MYSEINCVQVISYQTIKTNCPLSKKKGKTNLSTPSLSDFSHNSGTSLFFKLLKFPTKSAQIFGYLPYQLVYTGDLTFSLKSVPFFLLLIHLSYSIFWKILGEFFSINDILQLVQNKTDETISSRSSSSTERFCEHLVTTLILFVSTGIRLMTLLDARKVIEFNAKLAQILENLEKRNFENVAKFVEKSARHMKVCILISTGILFVPNAYFRVLQFCDFAKIWETGLLSRCEIVLYAIGASIKNLTSISEAYYIFWIAAIAQGIQLGFFIFTENCTEINDGTDFERNLRDFQNLKSLLDTFNREFSRQIILMLLCYSGIWVIDVFLLTNRATAAYTADSPVLNGVAICVICFVANNTIMISVLPIVSTNLGDEARRAVETWGNYGMERYPLKLQMRVRKRNRYLQYV